MSPESEGRRSVAISTGRASDLIKVVSMYAAPLEFLIRGAGKAVTTSRKRGGHVGKALSFRWESDMNTLSITILTGDLACAE
jgi:hypothetical protein